MSVQRYYWYKSWFMPNTAAFEHVLHLFPHWNWDPAVNASVEVWAYSNANEIELFLNGNSQVSAKCPCAVCSYSLFLILFLRAALLTPLMPTLNGLFSLPLVTDVAAAKSCVPFHAH